MKRLLLMLIFIAIVNWSVLVFSEKKDVCLQIKRMSFRENQKYCQRKPIFVSYNYIALIFFFPLG